MEKLISWVMYSLWVLTIMMIFAATLTKFQNEDLNVMAGILLVFSSLNSFFILSRKR